MKKIALWLCLAALLTHCSTTSQKNDLALNSELNDSLSLKQSSALSESSNQDDGYQNDGYNDNTMDSNLSASENFDQYLKKLNTKVTRPNTESPRSDVFGANQASGLFSCPGLDLVITCGDGKCNAKQGENETSCPADCKAAEIKSYNFQTICSDYQDGYEPSNLDEFKQAVKNSIRAGYKIKIGGNNHSANGIMCGNGVSITTKKLNKIIGLETHNGTTTVKVEPGVTLYQLADWLHQKGYSIGYNIMGFRVGTIAGLIGTGSHGSSPKHTSVISNIVDSVDTILADGSEKTFDSFSDENKMRAWRTHLGFLGAITTVSLKVQPQFNLDVKVSYHSEKEFFGSNGGAINQVKDCDWGIINWFPGSHKFVKSCGVVTNKPADRGANNTLLDPYIPQFIVKPFKKVLQLGACYNGISCLTDKVRYLGLQLFPPFTKIKPNGKKVFSTHVIGPSHRMMSADLTKYQQGFTQLDWEIAVPARRAEDAIRAIKQYIDQHHICLPLVGVFIRFSPSEDKALLAHTTTHDSFVDGEPVVFFEMPVYIPVGFTQAQRDKIENIYVGYTKLLVDNFEGRPHWGKNRDWAFPYELKQKAFGDKLAQYQSVVQELDPQGVFSNPFGKNFGLSWDADPNSACSNVEALVCAQGTTYQNRCVARQAGVSTEQITDGACVK